MVLCCPPIGRRARQESPRPLTPRRRALMGQPFFVCVYLCVCVCIPWIGRVDCSVYKCEPSVGIAHWSVYERMMDRERRW